MPLLYLSFSHFYRFFKQIDCLLINKFTCPFISIDYISYFQANFDINLSPYDVVYKLSFSTANMLQRIYEYTSIMCLIYVVIKQFIIYVFICCVYNSCLSICQTITGLFSYQCNHVS